MAFLQRISLKKKLFWGFFLCSIIILIVGGAGVLNINNTNGSIGMITTGDMPLLVKSEKLHIYALTHRRYEKDFFLNIGNEEKQRGYLKKFEKISEKTIATLTEAVELARENPLVDEQVKDALAKSRNAYDKYKRGFLALADKVFATPDITPQQANKLMKPIKNDIYAFEDGIKKAAAASEEIIASSTTELVDQGRGSRLVILLFLVGGVIFSLVLSYLISSSIIKSVGSVADGLKDIAEGDADLTMRLPVYCNDEIGEQAKWFNIFIEKLQGLIKEVAGGVHVLSSSSGELSLVSTKLSNNASEALERSTAGSAATEQMSSSMTTISSAMEESTSNISMVAAATEEMTSTVTEIAQNAAVAKGITEGAVAKSAQTTEKMNNLGEAATKISKVTEAITEISEQTNLLALNATIEAARAGEVGKGFAVVANEIKELARQTAEATVDIKNQIDNIQNTTSGTITDIQEISSVINEINEVITTIAAAVEQQSSATVEIAENIAQTSSGVSEVHENVSQVSATSDEISVEISEISLGADEINRDSNEVSQSADELMRLSDQLSGLIKRFKVA